MSSADNAMRERARTALQTLFVADALAMPVHWFYRVADIERQFPGGVQRFEAAPARHPSSVMALHSTSAGGRATKQDGRPRRTIVGEVILRGRAAHWGTPEGHYHRGMRAGENTLNAHCARVVMRSIAASAGHHDVERFLDDYIAFMTADPCPHPDTYAESYHRGFFANLEAGRPRRSCGAATHDTASIGGLVTIAPIVLAERLRGTPLPAVLELCRSHLYLTHPHAQLWSVCQAYVTLLDALLCRRPGSEVAELIESTARQSCGLDLPALLARGRDDREVVGGQFSSACYIADAWPSVLYLAYRYREDTRAALIANTNLGGDNVHRGAVLGTLLGLTEAGGVAALHAALVARAAIDAEIDALLDGSTAP